MTTASVDTPHPAWDALGYRPVLLAPEAEPTAALGTSPRLAVALLVAWVTSGLVTAYVMRRRGHDFRPVAALGFVFGPLFIPLALDAVRHREPRAPSHLLSDGRWAGGPVDVLIGLVGPAETVADVVPVLDLLGPRVGRVTVAVAIDYESAESDDWSDAKGPAALELKLAAVLLSGRHEPATVLVAGSPERAFVRYAAEARHDLVMLVGVQRRAPAAGTLPGAVAIVVPARSWAQGS
ncbi:MAG: hypothetical protein ACRDZ9_05865 [Acidimicrobiales bacterium]